MKLRIKGDSLRLRLTQGEVKQLETDGAVAELVHFGAGAELTYRVETSVSHQAISANFSGNVIDIRIPREPALTWARTDRVTLSHSQAVTGGELRIVIEKDWNCLAPRSDEDESDSFPHPDTGKAC